jgi:hypothetical protein
MDKKYGDDERRSDATHFSPALRVAAAGGHLLRHFSSAYSLSSTPASKFLGSGLLAHATRLTRGCETGS